MRHAVVALIAFGILLPSAFAEYRAYELAITNQLTGQIRTVTTVLDDIQYRGYHPVAKTESVEIRSTWMCWRRSDYFKAICPNPAAPAPPGAGQTANSSVPAPAAP